MGNKKRIVRHNTNIMEFPFFSVASRNTSSDIISNDPDMTPEKFLQGVKFVNFRSDYDKLIHVRVNENSDYGIIIPRMPQKRDMTILWSLLEYTQSRGVSSIEGTIPELMRICGVDWKMSSSEHKSFHEAIALWNSACVVYKNTFMVPSAKKGAKPVFNCQSFGVFQLVGLEREIKKSTKVKIIFNQSFYEFAHIANEHASLDVDAKIKG